MEFSKGIKMGKVTVLSLCLSEAVVNFVQEMVKISIGQITRHLLPNSHLASTKTKLSLVGYVIAV